LHGSRQTTLQRSWQRAFSLLITADAGHQDAPISATTAEITGHARIVASVMFASSHSLTSAANPRRANAARRRDAVCCDWGFGIHN
jgi:hypothetical protein